mgnify:CR=1 FL=1
MKPGVLVKYRDFLPVTANTPMFSLGEGDTPLVRCEKLEKEIQSLLKEEPKASGSPGGQVLSGAH